MKALLLLSLVCGTIACAVAIPSEPEGDCATLDFESGIIDHHGDYFQDPFLVQFIIDPRVASDIVEGALVFSTDSVSFQFFMPLRDPGNQLFYFDFAGIALAGSGLDLTFVGDNFDTLRVNTAGLLVIPAGLFVGTTQIHCYGRADSLSVDNVEVCNRR